jgi:hypothetical protein
MVLGRMQRFFDLAHHAKKAVSKASAKAAD